ncbi:MAG: sensor histidine kinase, partial [Sphaerochaetaceae bacterium]
NLVPLSMELDNTKNYFFIQQYRFGDRISLDLSFLDNCEEQALRIKIPKLTLQPIVENAIVHGLECKSGKGRILINVEILDSRLLIVVKDNGVGMDEETTKTLRKKFVIRDNNQMVNNNNEGGIALQNVNQRIKILFGEQYGLEVTSWVNVGTDITINLPVEDMSKEEEK